jgi:hypothetical protein
MIPVRADDDALRAVISKFSSILQKWGQPPNSLHFTERADEPLIQ